MSITELEDEIRNYINHPRRQYLLLQDSGIWNKLCSALDVIGDTELAVDAYLSTDMGGSDGEAYLIVYGILQVLLVQQDAYKKISEALDLPIKKDKTLEKIRIIRNDSIGHPMISNEKKRSKSSFIVRSSLCKGSFELMTVYSDETPELFQSVNIQKLIEDQKSNLSALLKLVVERLREEEMAHKEQFSDKKLSSAFPQTIGYYFQKIYQATRGERDHPFGAMHIKLVKECIQQFESMIKERGPMEAYDSITYQLDMLNYPIEQLEMYFSETIESKLNSDDAYIFTHFVQSEMTTLQSIAKEIDEEYEV